MTRRPLIFFLVFLCLFASGTQGQEPQSDLSVQRAILYQELLLVAGPTTTDAGLDDLAERLVPRVKLKAELRAVLRDLARDMAQTDAELVAYTKAAGDVYKSREELVARGMVKNKPEHFRLLMRQAAQKYMLPARCRAAANRAKLD